MDGCNLHDEVVLIEQLGQPAGVQDGFFCDGEVQCVLPAHGAGKATSQGGDSLQTQAHVVELRITLLVIGGVDTELKPSFSAVYLVLNAAPFQNEPLKYLVIFGEHGGNHRVDGIRDDVFGDQLPQVMLREGENFVIPGRLSHTGKVDIEPAG